MTRNITVRYTLFGIFFGLLFPIFSTFLDMVVVRDLPLSWFNFFGTHLANPTHWVVDSAPLFLGIFAGFAGSRQQTVDKLNQSLLQQIADYTQKTSDLELQHTTLQKEIVNRNNALDRQINIITAATKVGKSIAAISSMDKLLQQIPSSIVNQLGYHHVAIYLLDETREAARLRAANGIAGQRMLAREHEYKIGTGGLVDQVITSGNPVISLDIVGLPDTPLELPDARSRVILPITTEGPIAGVLDILSNQPNEFSQEDITALTVLADELSLAIRNAKLLDQLQESLDTERRAYGDISTAAWRNLIASGSASSYRYFQHNLSPAKGEWSPAMSEALISGQHVQTQQENSTVLTVPIRLGGQTLGVLNLHKHGKSATWDADELDLLDSLTEQLSLTLDSARLYQETQRRAAQEQLTGQITTEIRQTLDIETIIKTAAQRVREAMDLPEVTIRLSSLSAPTSEGSGYGTPDN
ncbi:MAG: GAF domain-containing protein [Anaerolineae bacterium]|nr:GAF domain-containing protein [Anaerolineae bacterium]